MSNHDLKSYREAKTIGPHIEGILRVLNLTTIGLSMFKSYLPVMRILQVIKEQQSLLEVYREHYKEILKNKSQF